MGWSFWKGYRHCESCCLRGRNLEFANDDQPGGQDSQTIVKDLSTKVNAQYLLQTADEPPAYIAVKTSGWRTGSRDILEKLQDPAQADTVIPTTYKFRINIELETGDERYAFVNTCMWIGSGCRRANEGELDLGP